MPNIPLKEKKKLSTFRRIAIGAWKTGNDASMYGSMDFRVDEAIQYIEEFRRKTGQRLTMTHLVTRSMGAALEAMPEANSILRLHGLYPRKRMGICLMVMIPNNRGKVDLSMATIHDVAEKTVSELVREIEAEVEAIKARKGSRVEGTRSTLGALPGPLLRVAQRTMSFLSYTLNLDLTKLGVPNDPFGSVIITNVSGFGMQTAYAPLVPHAHVPIILTVGDVYKAPVVNDQDKVEIQQLLRLNVTIDHRYLDAYHAGVMSNTIREWMEHPYQMMGEIRSDSAVSPTPAQSL